MKLSKRWNEVRLKVAPVIKSPNSWYNAYGIALLSVFVIWLLRALALPWVGTYAPLQPFLIAVMVSAWFGGFGPGLFAAVVGVTAGSYSFLIPFDSFTSGKLYHAWIESLIIPEGALISLLSSLLHKTRIEAEKANEAKSFFLANISHEMRTPLTAITGFADLLAQNNFNTDAEMEERKRWLEAIQRNSQLLSHIIQDILDLSKVEANALHVDKQSFSIKKLLHDMEEVLKIKAAQKSIHLKISVASDVPEFIRSDPYRLQQVLINLVGNAIKFTEAGTVKVSVQLSGILKKTLCFTVQDSGIGISLSEQKNLFFPFSQVNRSLTRNAGGTGLGLVLSRKIAQLLEGDVRLLSSEPNVGSVFVLEIPLESVEPNTMSSATAISKIATPVFPNPIKILVVDDAPDTRMLIGQILTLAGATVEFGENGLEATEKVQSMNFDCLLIDLQMPVMDGYQATKIIRRNNIHIPIIALTAHGFEDERKKVLQEGFSGFLTKPVSGGDLIETIVNFL